jgi:hypothetical protein
MIDQLGGWSPHNVGGQYGAGFELEKKVIYLRAIVICSAPVVTNS